MAGCEECNKLMGIYREAAKQRQEAVERLVKVNGDDLMAFRIMDEFANKCAEANDLLLRHIRDKHRHHAI